MQIILLMSQAPGDFPDTPVVQEKKKCRSNFNPLGNFAPQLSNFSLHKNQLGSLLKFQNAGLSDVLVTHKLSKKKCMRV